MQEDHVLMAWGSARKLCRVVDNVRRILAVEYAIAARAVDLDTLDIKDAITARCLEVQLRILSG